MQYNLNMYQNPSNLANVTELYSYEMPGNVAGKRMQITMWGNDSGCGTWEQAMSDPIDVSYTYRTDGQVNSVAYPKSIDNPGNPNATYTPIRFMSGYDAMGRVSTLNDNYPTDAHPNGSPWVSGTQYL